MENTIFRLKKEENYVSLDKGFLNNDKLSLKAKGLLALMLSRPNDWKFREKELLKQSTDGKDSFKSGIKELEKNGYIKRTPLRDDKGKYIGFEWLVFERPQNTDV